MSERRHRRKVRVIHTRVPEVLEVELKRLSDSLSVPVSNIVRAVLEDALEVAESIEEDVKRAVEDGEVLERLEKWRERRERHIRRRREAYRRRREAEERAEGREPEREAEREPEGPPPRREADVVDLPVAAAEPEAPEHSDASEEHEAPELPEEIVGVQPLRLVRNGRCVGCDVGLKRGEDAYMGIGHIKGPPPLICADCAP
ncbi:MAG: hypothetical protein OEZ06_03265 [Myxococcales bacterium]|nr:hypothetical protein [Myxococcales bacterium]